MHLSAKKPVDWISYGFMVAIVLALYLPGLAGKYYADDFQFFFSPPPSFFHFFTHVNPTNVRVYRPIEATYLAFVQNTFGFSTFPIHVLGVCIHLGIATLVFLFLRRRYSTVAAFSGGVIFAVSQINVHAVMSNDTLSQTLGTFFTVVTYLSYALFLKNRGESAGSGFSRYYLAALFCFPAALFAKETSISIIAGVMLIGMYAILANPRNKIAPVVRSCIPFFVFTILYMLIRSNVSEASIALGSDRYNFAIGPNILVNAVQYFAGAFLPISSVAVFGAVRSRDLVVLSCTGFAALLYTGIVAYGLIAVIRDRARRAPVALLVLLAVTGAFPVILLNHVSELYVYNSMPFLATVMGIGIGSAIGTTRNRPARLSLVLVLAAMFAMQFVASTQKVGMMRENGDRAEQLIAEISAYARDLPPNGRIYLLNPPDGTDYSVFRMSGFTVLENGVHSIKDSANRPDISISLIASIEPDMVRSRPDAVVFLRETNGSVSRID